MHSNKNSFSSAPFFWRRLLKPKPTSIPSAANKQKATDRTKKQQTLVRLPVSKEEHPPILFKPRSVAVKATTASSLVYHQKVCLHCLCRLTIDGSTSNLRACLDTRFKAIRRRTDPPHSSCSTNQPRRLVRTGRSPTSALVCEPPTAAAFLACHPPPASLYRDPSTPGILSAVTEKL